MLPPPSQVVDTLFENEELLRDLSPETVQMACDFRAFTWARKIQTPAQLLRVILTYGGLDKSLRDAVHHGTAVTGPGADRSLFFQPSSLYPLLSALDSVAFGLMLQGIGREGRRQRAEPFVHQVGSGLQAQTPAELSAGDATTGYHRPGPVFER
jgi:hypothetical protein